ncbi:MAG TPA: GNAT family N-acetyltransferase, partial [Candidatus Binatia bacterium]
SERGRIGLVPGHRLEEVLPALHAAARARAAQMNARVIVYKDFAKKNTRVFDAFCGLGLAKMVSYPGTRMGLKGAGFESHLKTLKSSRRYKIRKKLERGRDAAQLRGEVVQHPSPPLVEEIFALYRQTYQKGKIKFERMTPQFFRAMAGEDLCHFVLLRRVEDAGLAAFMMCLRVDSRVVNKFVGLDYGVAAEAFLYFRLYEHAVDWASRAGAREFHSGQGTYASKLELGHGLIPLYNYFEHQSPLLHRLFARLARSLTWSRLDGDLKAYAAAHPETPGGTIG